MEPTFGFSNGKDASTSGDVSQRPSQALNHNSVAPRPNDLENRISDKAESIVEQFETMTSKIPTAVYLGLAVGSIALSAVLAATSKRKDWANFVGMWAPTLLVLGLYNKAVKGHETGARP